MKLKVAKLRLILLYSFLPAFFFSYHPVISLGSSDTTNFELSLPLIILVLFTLTSLTSVKKVFERHQVLFPLLLLPAYLTLSATWSANPFRAILTAGIVWCLLFSALTIPELIISQKIKNNIVKIYLISTLLVCVFCWIQCALDVIGVEPASALLCDGCSYRSIGFAHPNGFAIEPQFMGNLLLVPAILCLLLLRKHRKPLLYIVTFFIFATLFITFSRGAIYAFLVALLVITVYEFIKKQRRHAFTAIIIAVLSFAVSLVAQGTMTALNPTADTFKIGVARSISQLTLGRIELFPEERNIVTDEVLEATENYIQQTEESGGQIITNIVINDTTFSGEPQISSPENAISSGNQSSDIDAKTLFTGYIAESTEERLKLTRYALGLWNDSFTNIVFGIGVGASGPRLFEKRPNLGHAKEIVQNEYIAILLETGLVGVSLCIMTVVLYLRWLFLTQNAVKTAFKKFKASFVYIGALLIAYSITLFFFSGLPNALHIYLVSALLVPTLSLNTQPRVSRTRRHQKN